MENGDDDDGGGGGAAFSSLRCGLPSDKGLSKKFFQMNKKKNKTKRKTKN